MRTPRSTTLISMIALAAVARVLPHPWNVTPLAAMALFSGAHFENTRYGFFVAFSSLLLSDLFLGFHMTMLFVYSGFGAIVLLGTFLKSHKTLGTVIFASLIGSVLFFLITNFGSWLLDGMYAKTPWGLLQAYVAGLPFFRNTVAGDLFYVGLLFGSFALAEKRLPILRSIPQ